MLAELRARNTTIRVTITKVGTNTINSTPELSLVDEIVGVGGTAVVDPTVVVGTTSGNGFTDVVDGTFVVDGIVVVDGTV